jgi:polysaccharide export outer membrane protein
MSTIKKTMSVERMLRRFLICAVLMASMAGGWCLGQTVATPPAPATEAHVAAPTISADITSSTYLLQPYDVIDVDVFNEEDLHKPARLGADGTVLLPLIGSVKLGGLTVAQATVLITQRYGSGFVKNPNVLITVLQYRKSTFSMLGQVVKPGIYEIPEGAHVTIVDAISLAGGYTPMAAENSVTVKRMIDGRLSILTVKAADMVQDAGVVPFEIFPGDIVLVQFRNSSFSILGQIQKPGIYEIPEGSHLNIIDAVLMAGGFTRTAAQNSVTVKRTVNGRPVLFKVKAGKMAQDPDLVPFEVLPGDIVKVNESWF